LIVRQFSREMSGWLLQQEQSGLNPHAKRGYFFQTGEFCGDMPGRQGSFPTGL